MSWSFNAIGMPPAVKLAAHQQLSRQKCKEPEETLKGQALSIIEHALAEFPDDVAVKIEAYGSQSQHQVQPPDAEDGTKPEPVMKYGNALTLKIEPLYGFLK